MATIVEKNGVKWLEPSHKKLTDLMDRCAEGIDIDTIKNGLPSDEWEVAAKEINKLYRSSAPDTTGNATLHKEVNDKLANYALSFFDYGVDAELKELKAYLDESTPDISKIKSTIFQVVMAPRIRAVQLKGRFEKLDIFEEFCYIIESSTLSFYRGNLPSSLLAIIPVIEGVLLRWQGFSSMASGRPDFKTTKEFVRKSVLRQPMPALPHFISSWIDTAEKILNDHFFKDTRNGPPYELFNRHLALHMLEDADFCTPENVARSFLLLDLLSGIYVCEKKIADPRFDVKHEEEEPHILAYESAANQQFDSKSPEMILLKYR